MRLQSHYYVDMAINKILKTKNEVLIVYYKISIWPPSALTLSEQRYFKLSKVFPSILSLIFIKKYIKRITSLIT